MKRVERANIWLFRRSRGRIGGRWGKAGICLLTTTGRKSGKSRTVPLLFLPDGERVVLVASRGGTDHHPAWYLNLTADPAVEVEIGRERRALRAREAREDEREDLWRRLIEIYPDYANYRSWTDRRIPLVVLEPRS